VSGVGFLGAGAIIVRREGPRGLTTAASVWVSAAVGLAIGGGLWIAGVSTTAITLLVLAVLKRFEARFFKRPLHLGVMIDPELESVLTLRAAAEESGLRVERIDVRMGNKGSAEVRLSLGERTPERDAAVVDRLRALPGVRRVKLRTPI
jgi:putative Mg2+ transporter-C (MgtC) family protein